MKFSLTLLGLCVLLVVALAEGRNVHPKKADTKSEETKAAETKTEETKPASENEPSSGSKPATDDKPSNDQPATDDNLCANLEGERNLKNLKSGQGIFGSWHCMTYTHCKDKKPETRHCFGWPLLPLKQYSPSAQECQWFWNVRCGEEDAKPQKQ